MTTVGELARTLGADLRADGPGSSDADAAAEVRVSDVEHDSRRVRPGALFACIPGETFDGHRFAADATAAGAVALLVERPVEAAVPCLVVESVRRAVGPAAAAVHGHPSRRLDLVGVTGTNGKTTTVRLVAGLMRSAGRDAVEIGTLTGALTTPEAGDLQRTLAEAAGRGADATAVEVSSHGLAQHRVDGCRFRAAAFTKPGPRPPRLPRLGRGLLRGQGQALHRRAHRAGGGGRHRPVGPPPRGGGRFGDPRHRGRPARHASAGRGRPFQPVPLAGPDRRAADGGRLQPGQRGARRRGRGGARHGPRRGGGRSGRRGPGSRAVRVGGRRPGLRSDSRLRPQRPRVSPRCCGRPGMSPTAP